MFESRSRFCKVFLDFENRSRFWKAFLILESRSRLALQNRFLRGGGAEYRVKTPKSGAHSRCRVCCEICDATSRCVPDRQHALSFIREASMQERIGNGKCSGKKENDSDQKRRTTPTIIFRKVLFSKQDEYALWTQKSFSIFWSKAFTVTNFENDSLRNVIPV